MVKNDGEVSQFSKKLRYIQNPDFCLDMKLCDNLSVLLTKLQLRFLQEEYVSIDLETLRDSDIFCKILPPKNEENDKILEEAGTNPKLC